MSNLRKSRAVRRARTQTAVQRQVTILKALGGSNQRSVDQPNRLAKRHALNCGRPHRILCANPRHHPAYKGRSRLTRQELRAGNAEVVE